MRYPARVGFLDSSPAIPDFEHRVLARFAAAFCSEGVTFPNFLATASLVTLFGGF